MLLPLGLTLKNNPPFNLAMVTPVSNRMLGKKAKPGLTFLELILVMMLLGIAAAIAAPKFTDVLATARLNGAVNRLVADLEYAKRSAKTTGKDVTFTFDKLPGRYTLSNVQSLDRFGRNYSVNFADSAYSTMIDSSGIVDSKIRFNRFQIPSNGGKIKLTCGNLSRYVLVNVETGEITSQ